ncbi:WD-REPEATS-REGION domain-containing protein [Mycena venus]|uniref:WD-REPEATS-REGION domain-containing protein n=1 Tax=Mycena venus TaxID=2733690 RepID=A0A8H6XN66_9AGAR|nr:WD-REPEATS-REGION domain-containing protein [Mycena venus]
MNSLQLTPSPNRLRRRGLPATPPNSTQRFSRLLTSVLGSPFLTTTDMATLPPHLDLVDGDDTAVLHTDTVTRPPSPENLYGFEVVHREDGPAGDDDQWPFKRSSPFRSLLPRIWDVLSTSPPRRPSPFVGYNNYGGSNSSIWASSTKQIDYAQLPPLDGEEGELIDDEACFFCPPVRAVTGIDILTLLPPELSLHILSLLLSDCTRPDPRALAPTVLAALADHAEASTAALHALLACRAVSRKWERLASDNSVWRAAFIARWGPPPALASLSSSVVPSAPVYAPPPAYRPPPPPRTSSLDVRMKKLPALPPDAASVSASSSSAIPTSSSTPISAPPAPLTLDWRLLYRVRFELDRRWEGSPSSSTDETAAAIPWEPRATALSGHADSVYCLEFSRTHIITGSRDRTIKVWGLKSGKLLGTFAGRHRGSVLCLKFELEEVESKEKTGGNSSGRNRKSNAGKDGRLLKGLLVTGSSDCTVCVWDLWTERAGEDAPVHGEVRAVLKGHGGGVLDLRIDKKWIVSCSKDAAIRVWARDTLALHRTLRGHEGPVNAVGLQSGDYDFDDESTADEDEEEKENRNENETRHNGRVVSASGDGKMILWDIASGERVRTFEGHDRGLACIEFKGDLIISGSNDCKIKIWSAATGACLRTLVGHEALVRALSFDPRSGRLVSASYDKSVRVWDLGTGKVVRVVRDSHTSHIFDVKFDARRIVSTSHDQKIVVLDFSGGLGVDPGLFV